MFDCKLALLMKTFLIGFIFLTLCSQAQSQPEDCSIVLNHVLIVVDSTTYQALINSDILHSDFAFGYDKNKNWEAIYLIGQDNYIEIFHPKSLPKEEMAVGSTWICQASLVANCIEIFDLANTNFITYDTDEAYDYLSLYTHDSTNLFTTWEMNKSQYESWTNKAFNDSLIFLTTDYNSPAESDSSKNYLFKNLTGIEINLNVKDSLRVVQYLNLIGYRLASSDQNKLRFTNAKDFVELHFSTIINQASISVIHFELNRVQEFYSIPIGSSQFIVENTTGKWVIQNPSHSISKDN